jgi:hypothetical protein
MHLSLFPFVCVHAQQEDTRFVPRVALASLNPDLEFEVVGDEEYGGARARSGGDAFLRGTFRACLSLSHAAFRG